MAGLTDTAWHLMPGPLVLLAIVLALTVEAGLLVGFLVPGTAIGLGAGALSPLVGLPLPLTTATVAAGAIAGGQLGFTLGQRHRSLPAPFVGTARLGGKVWPRAADALRHRPRLTVALGQWASYGRVVVPRGAGWTSVSRRAFTVVQSLSATAWAATLTTTGSATTATARANITFAMGLPVAGLVALAVIAALVIRTVRRRATTGAPAAARPTRAARRALVRWAIAGSAMTLTVASAGACGTERTFVADVPLATAGTTALDVRTSGLVRVVPADGAVPSLHREVHVSGDTSPPLAELSRSGATTVIRDCLTGCISDLTLRVPRGTVVRAQSPTGPIDVRGMGATTAASDSGPATIKDIIGDVNVRSSSGPLAVERVSGRLEATSASGPIAVRGVDGPVNASSDSAPTTIEMPSPGTVAARSQAGDVSVIAPDGAGYAVEAADLDRPDVGVSTADESPYRIVAVSLAGQVQVGGDH